jgi:hypothetical protein
MFSFVNRFFWQAGDHKKEYRFTKWNIVCQLKHQRGPGIQNIDFQNQCLLSKWLVKLIKKDEAWNKLLRRYLRNQTIG